MSVTAADFERLYNRNRDDIFAYVIRSVREENTALDILQDVFLNFFNIYRNKTLPGDVECRMYLFRIARNLIINHSKRAYTRKVDLVEDYEGREANRAGSGGGPEDQVVRQMGLEEAITSLDEMMSQLEPDERQALELRYNQDMLLEEIAGVLGVSISTVSRLLRKAARNLVKLGQERGFDAGSLDF